MPDGSAPVRRRPKTYYRRLDEEPPELERDDDPEDDVDDEPLDDDADEELESLELDEVLLELVPLGEPEPEALDEPELEAVGCVNPSAQPAMSPLPRTSVTPVNVRRKSRRS